MNMNLIGKLIELTYTTVVLSGTCMFIFGLHCLLRPGYIFGFFGEVLDALLPEWVSKPLFMCPPCMASIYGISSYVMLVHRSVGECFVFVICLAGLNYIMVNLFKD